MFKSKQCFFNLAFELPLARIRTVVTKSSTMYKWAIK